VAAFWTGLAFAGLAAIFALVPWAYLAARLVGAAYLFWVAWGMWRGASQPMALGTRPARHAFRDGMLINLTNPKSVLFAAAVLVVIFPGDMSAGAKLAVVMNHLVIEVVFYSALALMLSRPAMARACLRARLVIDKAAALVLGALGLRLLFGR